MGKTYTGSLEEPLVAAEPVAAYNAVTTSHPLSTHDKVMASTRSVDEYFDELISLVHQDYASV